jgi:hypothetical protein
MTAKEPWSDDTILYVPESDQLLVENGGAECIASVLYLDVLSLKYELRVARNVVNMSPSNKSPLLKCGRYSIGEYEPIVNFCQLKVKFPL